MWSLAEHLRPGGGHVAGSCMLFSSSLAAGLRKAYLDRADFHGNIVVTREEAMTGLATRHGSPEDVPGEPAKRCYREANKNWWLLMYGQSLVVAFGEAVRCKYF